MLTKKIKSIMKIQKAITNYNKWHQLLTNSKHNWTTKNYLIKLYEAFKYDFRIQSVKWIQT